MDGVAPLVVGFVPLAAILPLPYSPGLVLLGLTSFAFFGATLCFFFAGLAIAVGKDRD